MEEKQHRRMNKDLSVYEYLNSTSWKAIKATASRLDEERDNRMDRLKRKINDYQSKKSKSLHE